MTDDPRLAEMAAECEWCRGWEEVYACAHCGRSDIAPVATTKPSDAQGTLRNALYDSDAESLMEHGEYNKAAAAILAALPSGWCGHEAEIARLRKIEEVAQAVLMAFDEMPGAVAGAMPVGVWVMFYNSIRGLRAALEGGSE